MTSEDKEQENSNETAQEQQPEEDGSQTKGVNKVTRTQLKGRKRKDKMIDALSKTHGIISYACELTGIAGKTYYEWLKTDKAFAERAKEAQDIAEEKRLDLAESVVLNALKGKESLKAATYLLDRKGRRRGYVESRDLSHAGGIEYRFTETRAVPASNKDR